VAVWWASHAVRPSRVRPDAAGRGLRVGASRCMLGESDRMCAGGRPGGQWSRLCADDASGHGRRWAGVYRARCTPAGGPALPSCSLGQTGEGLGGQGHPVVRTETRRASTRFAYAGEHGLGLEHTGGGARLAAKPNAAVASGHGERITEEAGARCEGALAIGAPDLVGGQELAGGLTRRAHGSTVSCLGPHAMAVEAIADRGARGSRPARMLCLAH
jgi:hypothetical protein